MDQETLDSLLLARELGTNSRRTNLCLKEIVTLRTQLKQAQAQLAEADAAGYRRGMERGMEIAKAERYPTEDTEYGKAHNAGCCDASDAIRDELTRGEGTSRG